MAERTSEGQRVEFYRRHVQGQTYAEIAQGCGVSLECVRYWCQKQKQGQGVQSRWHLPKRGVLSQFDPPVIQRIRDLRQQHPRWGPISLRLHLAEQPDLLGKCLPSPASIGRFLHADPANRRRPKSSPPRLPALATSLVRSMFLGEWSLCPFHRVFYFLLVPIHITAWRLAMAN
jgi:hypothetical protein